MDIILNYRQKGFIDFSEYDCNNWVYDFKFLICYKK